MNLGDMKKVEVLGAGTMEPNMAQIFAMGGFDVSLYTRSESTLEKANASEDSRVWQFQF